MARIPNTSGPDVSVIVPFRNSELYIERCLQALAAQSYPSGSYEILLVDNNSTDSSAQIVGKFPGAQLLSENKPGSYAARNCGVEFAQGQILAFTDADCAPCVNWLKELVATFTESKVGLVQGRRMFGVDGSVLSLLAAYEAEVHAHIFSGAVKGPVFGYTNNMAVRREVFDRCGPFPEAARGADSIFVDRVVSSCSYEVLRYAREACVQHLEIGSVRAWLRKKVIYGRSFQHDVGQRRLGGPRSRTERVALFKRTVEREGYSAAQAAKLLLVISLGNLAFTYGRFTSRVAID